LSQQIICSLLVNSTMTDKYAYSNSTLRIKKVRSKKPISMTFLRLKFGKSLSESYFCYKVSTLARLKVKSKHW
jgi:hypothetical protein